MKKYFTSAFLFVSSFSFAQQISNGGFENWTVNTLYEEPDSFLSTNSWAYMSSGTGNVTKSLSSFHGLYAAQLTTVLTPNDTMFGGLFIGSPGNQGVNGGIPYTGQPDSISVYVKYNIQPNDTAFFIVAFKNSGNMISMAVKTFIGTQLTYKRISIATNLPVSPIPDSLVAIISSSNLDPPRMPGSTLTLDSITMIGTNQPFPNPSFENWTPKTSEEPDNWTTINFGVAPSNPLSATKSTNVYNGTYAIRIETINTVWGQQMGFITNGYFGQNGPSGGMPVFANPQKITGYYMYFPIGPDTALASGQLYSNSIVIDSNMIKLTAKNTYTYFEIPFQYNGWPVADTLNIAFSSKNMFDTINNGLGSVLYVDDLNILYNPVGIFSQENSVVQSVYPNPFSNQAVIIFKNENSSYTIELYDEMGKLARKYEDVKSNSLVISKDKLKNGIYHFKIVDRKNDNISGSGKIIVE